MTRRIWQRGLRRLRRLGRVRDDRGTILVIALIIVTVIAVVVGALLTRGDGSIRATVKLREVAGTTYAADSAAQLAINALRTGYHGESQEPAGWAFANEPIPGVNPPKRQGCFGWTGDPANAASLAADPALLLKSFYPAAKSSGGTPTSAYVECKIEDQTGDAGPKVPINNRNKPGYALVTLGGPVDATGSKAPGLLVRGGIYSNGSVKGLVKVTEGGLTALGPCDATVTASPRNCNTGGPAIPDPGYASELGGSVPPFRKPPAACNANNIAVFEPGYYDDAVALTTATNKCAVAWFKPGTYYFDFHNDSCANVCPANLFGTGGTSSNVWRINGATVVGGTPIGPSGGVIAQPSSTPTIPGSCQNPITDVAAQGVQFVFGGSSQIYIDQNSRVELCASYHDDRPPIELYGLKTGSTPTPANANGLTALTVPTQGAFGATATAANIAAANDGKAATWTTTSGNAQSTTLVASGFKPAASIPAGSVLSSATLRICHKDADGTADSQASAKIRIGATTTAALTVPLSGTAVTCPAITIPAAELNKLQTEVHDNGFDKSTTLAEVEYTAKAKKNAATTTLDSIQLDLTTYAPVLRGQGGTCIQGGASGCKFISMKNGNNKIVLYFQGTTYVPYGDLDLILGNFASEIMKFGLVARQVEFSFWNGASDQDYPVIEIPDNSPGFGVKSTIVQLSVYVCPSSPTCDGSGRVALTSRVQLWDPDGSPVKNERAVRVLSWSHAR